MNTASINILIEGFWVHVRFHFSCINTLECDWWVTWVSTYLVYQKMPRCFSKVLVPLGILSSKVWEFQLLHTFLSSWCCLFFCFYNFFAIIIGIKWYFFWVYIFLLTNDVEHIFICLASIYLSFLAKWLFKSFVHFLIDLFS